MNDPSGKKAVEMEVTGLSDSLTKIRLSGRLDTPGVDRIETLFVAAVVPGSKSTIVDVSRVEFITSMGIRMLISVARSLRIRQARLALYGAQDLVTQVFENCALSEIIPIVGNESEAITAVLS
jgi:anti-anti-sigma factor